MSLIRTYLPLSPAQLQQLRTAHQIRPGPVGFAVTDSVRGADPTGDSEAWEHAALQDAAAHALAAGGPIIVAALDLEPTAVDSSEPAGSMVQVLGVVRLPRVASFHVGDDVLGRPVRSGPKGNLELSWYDTTEIKALASLVSQSRA